MTIALLEALVIIIGGVLAIAYPLVGSNGLRVACAVGGICACLVGVILAVHAGA